ncbi:LGT incomplete domain containing protein [Pandoravirus salinus]|uniref:LGT incomplete domain containing protein n=1 Tax=Pandoravirus salinus TaxID=1349410 RepID=S4VTU5_9VIRU|nr:LGT superfamily incomplete domain [Pandoravirus salinus]AGO83758.1 LGT incomplete domain containing protein [Pandoravirus salinus]
MSSSNEPTIDNGATPTEACDHAESNDAAAVDPQATGTPTPDQGAAGASNESIKACEASSMTTSAGEKSPSSGETTEGEASHAAPAETGESANEAPAQGEKRKEPDALADTPTQDDSVDKDDDDAEAAPAKKQKTDVDSEPASDAPLASCE